MKHVDVLGRNALQPAAIFEVLESLVNGAWRELAKPIDKLRATFVVDGRIAVEPIDIEDAFSVGLFVKALRTTEVGNATECGNARARKRADTFRVAKSVN